MGILQHSPAWIKAIPSLLWAGADEALTQVGAGWIHPLPAGGLPGESLQPMARDSMTG